MSTNRSSRPDSGQILRHQYGISVAMHYNSDNCALRTVYYAMFCYPILYLLNIPLCFARLCQPCFTLKPTRRDPWLKNFQLLGITADQAETVTQSKNKVMYLIH